MAATTAEVTTPTVPEATDVPAVTAAVRSWADIASAKDEPRAREDASDARAPSGARHAVDPAIDLPEATRDGPSTHSSVVSPTLEASQTSTRAPPTPCGLEAASVTAASVTLRWSAGSHLADPSSDESGTPEKGGDEVEEPATSTPSPAPTLGYEVQMSADGRPGTFTTVASRVLTCDVVVNGLAPARHHLFRVRATNVVASKQTESENQNTAVGSAVSEWSTPSLAVRTADGPPDAPMCAPSLAKVTDDTMTVAWLPPPHNGGCRLTRYAVEYKKLSDSAKDDLDSGWSVKEVPVWDGCEATLTGLTPATAYVVRVRAKNLVGLSKPSELFTASTEASKATIDAVAEKPKAKSQITKKSPVEFVSSEIVPFELTPPERPGECVATRTSTSHVRLEWAPVRDGTRECVYVVEWRDVGPATGAETSRSGGEWSVASSPARRRRRKGSNATTPLTLSPVRGVRARASSSSSSTTGEIGLDDMDCGASSVVSGSSVPPTVYSYGSGSSTTWSGSSTDSESDKGVITRPSKFTRTDVPLGACAVTLEGLRSNRLVQCRVVAVDVSTGTESEPGPIAVAYTDMSVPPAPSAPVCAVDLKSPGCIVLTWRVPEGSAKDDAASAPTAHQVQAAPALSRPFQTVSKRKGGDGKGGANKGSTKSGSNAVAGTGPRDASSPGELQWRVVYEGAESRVTLPEPELCGPGESIVFRCRAYNAAGAGAYGKLATHRRDAAAPSPPEPPTFTSVTPDGVKVRWRPPLRLNGSVVAAYRAQMQTVSRGAEGGAESKGAEWIAIDVPESGRVNPKCETRVHGLKPATAYRFRIAADRADGTSRSEFGRWSEVTTPRAPPAPPRPPAVCAVSHDSVTVSFTANARESVDADWRQRAVEYRLEVAGGGDGCIDEYVCVYQCGSMRERMHTIDGLLPGRRIRCRVRAIGDEGGTSVGDAAAARTTPVTVTPVNSPPSSPRAVKASSAGVKKAKRRAASSSHTAAAPSVTLVSAPPPGSLCRREMTRRRKMMRRKILTWAFALLMLGYFVLTVYLGGYTLL